MTDARENLCWPVHRALKCDPDCQLMMHKGYPTCAITGECYFLPDDPQICEPEPRVQ